MKTKLTEEQKIKRAASQKRYRENNKEKVAASKKKWRENNPNYKREWNVNNKDKIAASQKRWNKNNAEKAAEASRKWAANNPEKVAARKKRWVESHKDGLYTVYYLPEEAYVGQTENMRMRMSNHRSKGRDTKHHEILGKYKTREEAMAVEAKYHSMGFLGANKGF
jgi:hypothetical protein